MTNRRLCPNWWTGFEVTITALVLAIVMGPVICATYLAKAVQASPQDSTFTTLYAFKEPPNGKLPHSGLIRNTAGSLFGAAYDGGDLSSCFGLGCGVIFKLNPYGKETVLHAFTGPDGANPWGTIIMGAAGNIYGTTLYGGGNNSDSGVVFEQQPNGTESVLYSFTGEADGTEPEAGLLLDSAGNLYGTTTYGGNLKCKKSGCGVVFRLDPTGKETVLHTFNGGTDGEEPMAGLISDATGNLYGTTSLGGNSEAGTVFKLDPSGNETLLHTFTDGADGGIPQTGLIRDSSGNLYGTTATGGDTSSGQGFGVVFKLDPTGKETVLHSFTGGADGYDPIFGLIRDAADNLYGTTSQGGNLGCNCGVVFEIDPTGKETVLYTFVHRNGQGGGVGPGGLVQDSAGNIYGFTAEGGNLHCDTGDAPIGLGNGCGTIFELTP